MRIDWDALLPAARADEPPTAAPMKASAAVVSGIDTEFEAWEERAAIIEYEAGFARATAETMATAECTRRLHAGKWAARVGDDLRLCPECGYYRDSRCTIAKPGGVVSAARNYEPVPGLLRRCEGFAPLADDPDQRPGVARWPWLNRAGSRPDA
jgi:hypothetical protein